MNRVLALVAKDLRLFVADRRAVVITFLVPILIASFFGLAFGGSAGGGKPAKRIVLLVADEDGGPLVGKVVEALSRSATVLPKPSPSRASAEAAVRKGEASAALVFPKGFGAEAPRAMLGGDPPELVLRFDPSKSLEAGVARGAVTEAASRAVAVAAFGEGPATARPPFALKASPVLATKGGDADYSGIAHSFAGMAMQGVLFFGINAAMATLRDRRLGIWRRMRAAPLTLAELLLAKALSGAILGALVLAGVLLFGMAVFGVRVAGSVPGLLLVLVASAVMVSAFGLLVASLGRTEEQSRGLATVALLAMVMLGGAWFPTFLMPGWVQSLSYFVPVRWALDGFDAMLWRGGGFSAALAPAGGLLLFALLFGLVAALRFRAMPETA